MQDFIQMNIKHGNRFNIAVLSPQHSPLLKKILMDNFSKCKCHTSQLGFLKNCH